MILHSTWNGSESTRTLMPYYASVSVSAFVYLKSLNVIVFRG